MRLHLRRSGYHIRHYCLFITIAISVLFARSALAEVSYQYAVQSREAFSKPKLVIIIDDIGDNLPRGKRAVDLPGKVTAAFIPFTPNSKYLAKRAHQQGKELMLHMPMSSQRGANIGHGGLTPSLSSEQFSQRLLDAINDIPHIQGLNNHMGSQLTTMPKAMQQLMQELACHNLYFVDSRTSADSVAYKTAQHQHIESLVRDVFIDHERHPEAIHQAFEKLKSLAKQHGSAIGIAHPYAMTLDYLEQALPTLEQQGFELAFPSELLQQQRWYHPNHAIKSKK